MTESADVNPTWEEIYGRGDQLNRYPWDSVVSFILSNAARNKPRDQTSVLEVGFGAGSNLWFAAREGFDVSGVEGSRSAVDYAIRRFKEEGLAGDLRVGDFRKLPFPDASFDLAIDRGSLTCVGRSDATRALAEIRRTLRDGGRFLFNPYSSEHTSAHSGTPGSDGLVEALTRGTLVGVGPICFYERADVEKALGKGWSIRSLQHLELVDEGPEHTVHAEWRVIAEKRP
jgi:ubiquinone/menaquinone biosynthesis C-methylase UbiE